MLGRLWKALFGSEEEPQARVEPVAMPPARRPWLPPSGIFRFIALDVETARTDMWSICQIGVATVAAGGEIRAYSTLVNPNCKFSRSHVAIHGIDDAMVRGAPDVCEVLDALLPLLSRHAVFQHSDFDRRAVESADEAAGRAMPSLRWHDSVRIARAAWPEYVGDGGHGLAHLRRALALDFRHHDAGEDARAAAMVVLQAEQRLGLPFDQFYSQSARRRRDFPVLKSLEGAAGGPLAGQSVVFTGELKMPRAEAGNRAAALGMSVRNSVSRATTLLVVGQQDLGALAGYYKSSKHRRAEELMAEGTPIRVIGEAEFVAMVGEGPPPPPAAVRSVPRPAPTPEPSEVVVLACQLADQMEARAVAAGMMIMTNVTRRTTIVVVADDALAEVGITKTARHRSAEERIAQGQVIRIIGETDFAAMVGG